MVVDQTEGVDRGSIYIASYSYLTRSSDGGYSFIPFVRIEDSDPKTPSTPLKYPTLSVASDGVLYITGMPGHVLRSTNAGYSNQIPTFDYLGLVPGFSSFAPLARFVPNPAGLNGQIWIATHRSTGATRSNVYIGGPFVPTPQAAELDMVISRSTDDGTTWSDPIRINDDPENSGAWQWFGMISVAPNGRIDVAWNDTRNSGVPNVSELYYTYSTDGGETFAPNIPVSPPFDTAVGFPYDNPKIGDYYHMVSDNLGVNIAYAATFNGEQDIYFLRIGPWDCNGNEIDDALDISEARSRDCNANEVPDECEYRADLDGDGLTTLTDFAAFRQNLTGPAEALNGSCPNLLDIDHDGDIDLRDFHGLQRVFSGR